MRAVTSVSKKRNNSQTPHTIIILTGVMTVAVKQRKIIGILFLKITVSNFSYDVTNIQIFFLNIYLFVAWMMMMMICGDLGVKNLCY